MKLIIGGCAQGKLRYVLQKYGLEESTVADGRLPETAQALKSPVVLNHFHIWVKDSLERGERPEDVIEEFLDRQPECIVISDEVGNGIVPIEPFEREYRERLGRILIRLAQRAEEVERVVCGLGQKIK